MHQHATVGRVGHDRAYLEGLCDEERLQLKYELCTSWPELKEPRLARRRAQAIDEQYEKQRRLDWACFSSASRTRRTARRAAMSAQILREFKGS
jgi:hypothetical protein